MELEQRDTSTGTGPVSFGDKSAPLANVQEKSIVTESMPTKNKTASEAKPANWTWHIEECVRSRAG
jgi:hypothetical protein